MTVGGDLRLSCGCWGDGSIPHLAAQAEVTPAARDTAAADLIIHEIREMNLDALTPLEAINVLYQLKRKTEEAVF
jgi:hypothetical protein